MPVRIGVVIPTYNRRNIVGAAVDSVLAQTRPPDRIVVVDDGGKDDTMSFLATYGDRITAYRKPNGGVASARNAGVAQLDCDWITFLDDDDVWSPDRLAILERDLATAPDDVVAHLANLRFVGSGYSLDLLSAKGLSLPTGRAELVRDALPVVISGMSTDCAAVRIDAFRRVGAFDETLRMYEDTVFFWHLALAGPFLVTADIVSDGRRVEGDTASLTSAHLRNRIAGDTAYVQEMERLLDLGLSAAQRSLVREKLSGSMFALALLVAGQDRAAARGLLLRAARHHPSPVRGWVKSLLAMSPARSLLGPDRKAAMLRQ